MNGHSTLASYQSQLETFQRQDADRYAFVEKLCRDFEDLQAKYSEKCDDYDNERQSRATWQRQAREFESALTEQKQVSGSNSFALAIIDGDGAIFQDTLYAMGKEGGSEAAHRLYLAIKQHLKITYPDANVDDWNVVVQVVLNLQGLSQKLAHCNVVSSPSEVFEFSRGFGQAQPLFNFIDVGQGKERADHKIRETLRLFLPNAQCKHVFFGPCSDTGYITVLESYKRDYSERLTLIETRPAEVDFVALGLKRVTFPKTFRSDNLPAKPVIAMPPPIAPPSRSLSGTQMQASSAPFIPQSPSPAPSTDSAASTSWAIVGKAGAGSKSFNIATTKAAPRRYIDLNAYGERLDKELPRTDPMAESRFKDRVNAYGKFCNNYHLRGKCESGEYCDYQHGEKLTQGEMLVLKHKARSLMCLKKWNCRDFDCLNGHHCRHGQNCQASYCRFEDMHQIVLDPAKKLYEDGTEEWLREYLDKIRTRS